jgi:uncharacterized RDD family membrane protein YckC
MNNLKEYEIASFKRRFGAFVIDYLIIFLIWYTITKGNLNEVNTLMETLDPEIEGSLEILVTAIFKLYIAFIFKWIIVNTIMYTIFPAIFGDGKTIGKLIFGICVVDSLTFDEVSPSRLIFREFIVRNLLETIFVVPTIISMFLVCFHKESKSIHDLLAKTIVIKKSYSSTY